MHPDPTIRYEIISLMECILRKFKTVLAHYEKTISLSQFFGERVELLLNKVCTLFDRKLRLISLNSYYLYDGRILRF